MSKYEFEQYCRPEEDLRIPQIIEFLDLLKKAFRYSALYDSHSRPLDLTEAGLRKIFEKAAKRLLPGSGAIEFFYTIPPRKRDDNTVAIEIHTGTVPGDIFIDSYNISMDNEKRVPDFDYFEKSIEIFRPAEAYLSEAENEFRLDTYDRQQAVPYFSRPVIIRGFHYLDKDMARSIGGIKYCLKAPAWHVEEFCQGVLIELIPGLFDTENPEHLEVQQEVMEYFNIL